jgi:tripartite-type tricarboxylate transporter receptor subunit TctC
LRILVGSTGAGPDILARLVADRLRAARGWNVIVENRLGAGGRIAIDATKDAPPDGLTMMVVSIELLTLYPLVFTKLNYDSFKDFVPVSGITSSPYALAINAKSDYRDLAGLVAWLKANPKSSAWGTPGIGTPQQFLGHMLGREAGMEFRHVPYKGGAPALQDLMGGQIPCIITSYATAAGQARAGAIRILAHSAQSRLRSAPEIPTFAELGYKDLVAEGDFIIAAQSRAPAEMADVRSEGFRAAVEKLGQEPLPATPAEVSERMRRNHALWAGVVKATNFKALEE